MGKDTTGTIKTISISGVSFDVAADANLSRSPAIEKEGVPSSGRTMIKTTKKPALVEGVVIIANGEEQDTLETIVESNEEISLSYTTAADDTYRNTGTINIESMETEEGRVTLSMIPTTGKRWAYFAG